MPADLVVVDGAPLIAIVDDDPVVRSVLARVLGRLGPVRCHDFATPDALLAWLGDHLPDVVITDHHMGDMSGTELIGLLRSIPRCADVPTLMITSHDDRAIRHAALQAGASDFLTKPIDAEEVLLRTRNMLTLAASRRVLARRADDLQREVARATAMLVEREREIVIRLSRAAEQRDEETGLHVQRIAEYSRILARQLGLPGDAQQRIWLASPMHDVGKIGVPDAVLHKAGGFTPAERRIMQSHVQIGHDLLSGSGIPLLDVAAQIALRHHERWDGTGYPDGLEGTATPLDARIVAVADVFDALTSARPYKAAWSIESAIEYVRLGAGTQFDPTIVDAFLAAAPIITASARRLGEPRPPRPTPSSSSVLSATAA
ncbi:MAG: response regulator [Gemmatimonadaceae bacterium]|nr:response regulator [Gemmatimonadaceae bacterium]